MPVMEPPSQQPLATETVSAQIEGQGAASARRTRPKTDWLKIVLSLGIATSLVCIILQVVELSGDDCGSMFCMNELVTIILLVPSMYQFFRLLASYDGSLQDQKEKLAEKTKQLVDTMANRMNDIKEQRENFANNATEFAGSNFEKAKKHFTKRLSRQSRQNGNLYTDVKLVKEMRGFASRWIRTYSQCALDPSQVLNGMEDKLNGCSTIEELTECATGYVDRISRIKLLSPTEEDPANSYMTMRAITNDVEQGGQSAASSTQPSQRRCLPSWIKCGCHGHFGHDRAGRSRSPDGRVGDRNWPLTYNFWFGSVTILSDAHFRQLLFFVLDIGLIIYDEVDHQPWTLFLTLSNLLCVLSSLFCWEQIHEVSNLLDLVGDAEKKCQDLKDRFDEEKRKWEVVERMQGLWKNRTNPFLDIMDNIHEMLEDVEDPEFDRLAFLQLVTKSLDDVDKKLGDVKSWTQEGGDQNWKTQIGHRLKQMKSIVDPANFDQLNIKLVQLHNDLLMDEQGVLALTNSASSRQPSPRD